MGNSLAAPNTRKSIEKGSFSSYSYAACSAQGWRLSMEDAHVVKPFVSSSNKSGTEESHIFAVFDGHGGGEVSKFIKARFIKLLSEDKDFKKGSLANALRNTFFLLDELLRKNRYIPELSAYRAQGVIHQFTCVKSILLAERENKFTLNQLQEILNQANFYQIRLPVDQELIASLERIESARNKTGNLDVVSDRRGPRRKIEYPMPDEHHGVTVIQIPDEEDLEASSIQSFKSDDLTKSTQKKAPATPAIEAEFVGQKAVKGPDVSSVDDFLDSAEAEMRQKQQIKAKSEPHGVEPEKEEPFTRAEVKSKSFSSKQLLPADSSASIRSTDSFEGSGNKFFISSTPLPTPPPGLSGVFNLDSKVEDADEKEKREKRSVSMSFKVKQNLNNPSELEIEVTPLPELLPGNDLREEKGFSSRDMTKRKSKILEHKYQKDLKETESINPLQQVEKLEEGLKEMSAESLGVRERSGSNLVRVTIVSDEEKEKEEKETQVEEPVQHKNESEPDTAAEQRVASKGKFLKRITSGFTLPRKKRKPPGMGAGLGTSQESGPAPRKPKRNRKREMEQEEVYSNSDIGAASNQITESKQYKPQRQNNKASKRKDLNPYASAQRKTSEKPQSDANEEDVSEAVKKHIETLMSFNTNAGSTANCVAIQGNKLICANIGDSRAVLYRDGKAIALSTDHKPDVPEEKARIEKAGGQISSFGRINNDLNLSRSVGDLRFKHNDSLPPEQQMVSAEAEIKQMTLLPSDLFFITACDGIWDCIDNQQICEFVLALIHQGNTPDQIVEKITTRCISTDLVKTKGLGGDNMTIILVLLKDIEEIKRFSPPKVAGLTKLFRKIFN